MGELTLGHFVVTLVETIGQGAFGVVYGGTDTKTGKRVAVKMVRFKTEEDGHDAMEEIKMFDRLTEHPNLIRLLDFHYMSRACWMIMDFSEAGNLDDYLCAKNPDLAEKLTWMFQSACAIAHMHESKPPMIHRDIKPGNILLFQQSSGKVIAKVSDFGVSKLATTSAATAIFDALAGTPAFIAPEVFRKEPSTFSVDVFSLGLVFLAMIQHTRGDSNLYPRFVNRTGMVHIGVEMNSAAAAGGPQPKLCIVEDSDKPELKKLKTTILKMAAYDPNERCKALEVAEILGQITGARPVTQAAAKDKAALGPTSDKAKGDEREGLATRTKSGAARDKLKEELNAFNQYGQHKKFRVGDRVRVDADESKALRLQEFHGGWDSSRNSYLGEIGVVGANIPNSIKVKPKRGKRKPEYNSTVKVQFSDGNVLFFNPAMLTKVDTTNKTLQDGDFVCVIDSYEKVKDLQDSAHGGWKETMRECLGRKGVVCGVENDCVKVKFEKITWVFNSKALLLSDYNYMVPDEFNELITH